MFMLFGVLIHEMMSCQLIASAKSMCLLCGKHSCEIAAQQDMLACGLAATCCSTFCHTLTDAVQRLPADAVCVLVLS
jgi:hypothetical protein